MDSTTSRFAIGFGYGAVGTVEMSLFMLFGMLTGLSPMPTPIPVAVVGTMGMAGLPKPVLMVLAGLSHLLYGGFWAGVLAVLVRQVSIWMGLLLGFGLWLVMQVLILPLLGWGLFGVTVSPAIAAATLLLHVIYGGTVGVLIDRNSWSWSPAERPRSTRAMNQLRFTCNPNRKELNDDA